MTSVLCTSNGVEGLNNHQCGQSGYQDEDGCLQGCYTMWFGNNPEDSHLHIHCHENLISKVLRCQDVPAQKWTKASTGALFAVLLEIENRL
jgi:hypothetical protein